MIRFAFLFGAFVLLAPVAHAQTCTTIWTGAASSDFANFQNWTNGVPFPGAVGCIDGNGTNDVVHQGRPSGEALDHYGVIVLGGESGQHTLRIENDLASAKILFNQLLIRPTGTMILESGVISGFLENRGLIRTIGRGPNGNLAVASLGNLDEDSHIEVTNFGRIEILTQRDWGPFQGQLVNESDGVIEVQGDTGGTGFFVLASNGPDPAIINRGLITGYGSDSGNPAQASITGNADGLGLVNEGGRIESTGNEFRLDFDGGGARLEGGEYYAAKDAVLQFLNDPTEFEGILTGDPDGEVIINGGNAVATGDGAMFNFGGTGVVLESGSQEFSGTGWTNIGVLTMGGSTFRDATFTNEGLLRTEGASIVGSTIVNEVGATVEFTGDGLFGNSDTQTFTNRGRVVKTGGTGTMNFSPSVFNVAGGEICVEVGRLAMTRLSDEPGSVLCGVGEIDPQTAYLPRGTIRPGLSPGTLTWGQREDFGTETILDLEIDGPTPGTEHDMFVVDGALTLNGTLQVRVASDYDPPIGTEFVIIIATSITGDFDVLDLQGGLVHEINADNVTIIVDSPIVSIEDGPGDGIPSSFSLSSAYPNPFTARTAFTLDVTDAGRVVAEAFDALGRQVAVLHDGNLLAGTYTLHFEAEGLPSGLYMVRAHGAGKQQTQMVTVVR